MADRHLSHLEPAETRLGHGLAHPKLLLSIAMLAALGWITIGLAATHVLHVFMPSGQAWTAVDLGAAALMWMAMTLAMMLPSAGPMILTYAEIGDTAARKGERIVSPLVLTAGYLSIWFGFALVAALVQGATTRLSLLDPASASTGGLLSAGLFLAAGIYQFSALKHVCLTRCQRPFAFFFANWTTRRSGVFGLGLRQGAYCLGCCWVLMLLMFAVGVMNMAWMLVLALVIIGEKMSSRLSRPVGVLLILIGAALAIAAVQSP
jgi:predicted metal-binding membrane protein